MRPFIFTMLFSIVTWMSIPAMACDCSGFSYFLEGAVRPTATKVVLVENIAQVNAGVRARVIEVIRGEVSRDEIIILGDNGASCNGPLKYQVGEKWVAIIGNTTRIPDAGSYETPWCMATALSYDTATQKVSGDIAEGVEEMNYADLKSQIPTQQYIVRPKELSCRVGIENTILDFQDPANDLLEAEQKAALQNGVGTLNLEADYTLPHDGIARKFNAQAQIQPADAQTIQNSDVRWVMSWNYTDLTGHARSASMQLEEDDFYSHEYPKVENQQLLINIRPGIESVSFTFKRDDEPQTSVVNENQVTGQRGQEVPTASLPADPSQPFYAYGLNVYCSYETEIVPRQSNLSLFPNSPSRGFRRNMQ